MTDLARTTTPRKTSKATTVKPLTNSRAPVRINPEPSALALRSLETLKKTYGADLQVLVRAAKTCFGSLGRMPTEAEQIVVIGLDRTLKRRLLAQSATTDVRGWQGAEADLVAQAAVASSRSIEEFVRTAALKEAKSTLSTAARSANGHALSAAQRRGRAGVNEQLFIKAYNRCVEHGESITYDTLGKKAGLVGAYNQVKRFMVRRGLQQGIPTAKIGPEEPATLPTDPKTTARAARRGLK